MVWHILMLGLFVFVLRGFASSNYGLFTITVTGVVVQMIAMAGVSPGEVMAARALNTALGGVLALTAYALWPTWERTQIGEAIAHVLDAYRLYFRKIRDRYEDPLHTPASDTERIRVSGRLARSNLEASFDRLSAEPGSSEKTLKTVSAILASSHRMVRAMMALEAGLDGGPVAVTPAFSRFANQVELDVVSSGGGATRLAREPRRFAGFAGTSSRACSKSRGRRHCSPLRQIASRTASTPWPKSCWPGWLSRGAGWHPAAIGNRPGWGCGLVERPVTNRPAGCHPAPH